MAGHQYAGKGLRSQTSALNRNITLKFLQVNLQHSPVATTNLTEIIIEHNINIAFVQEPYTSHKNVLGSLKFLKSSSRWGQEENSHNNK